MGWFQDQLTIMKEKSFIEDAKKIRQKYDRDHNPYGPSVTSTNPHYVQCVKEVNELRVKYGFATQSIREAERARAEWVEKWTEISGGRFDSEGWAIDSYGRRM